MSIIAVNEYKGGTYKKHELKLEKSSAWPCGERPQQGDEDEGSLLRSSVNRKIPGKSTDQRKPSRQPIACTFPNRFIEVHKLDSLPGETWRRIALFGG